MADQQQHDDDATTTIAGPPDDWGSVDVAARAPVQQRLAIVIRNNLLDLKGDDSNAIVAIHNRQTLSNDLQTITLNIMATIFMLFGSSVVVFGPQSKATSVFIGIVMFVAACGTFGFNTLSIKGFGINATAGQAAASVAPSSAGWVKFFGGLALGIVLTSAAWVIWERGFG